MVAWVGKDLDADKLPRSSNNYLRPVLNFPTEVATGANPNHKAELWYSSFFSGWPKVILPPEVGPEHQGEIGRRTAMIYNPHLSD